MTIRWGILGCGDIVRKRVARAIIEHPGSQLLAACRRHAEPLRDFCRSFAVARGYTKEAELLGDRDVDAVYIATPVHLHESHTRAAAAAGKHVLVEKPMARSTAECDAMIDACQAAGVTLGVAYYRRFYPVVARLRTLVDEGVIGPPLSVSALTSTPFGLGPADDGYWRVVRAEGGGGALMDVGSHRLHLFLHLFGAIVDVKACCSTAGPYEAEDCATLLCRFQSGMHGTLQCFFGTAMSADDFTILGTKGSLTASPLNGGALTIAVKGEERHEAHPPADNLHAPLIADFVAAIVDERPPSVTGSDGRRTNEVMERAYADAYPG